VRTGYSHWVRKPARQSNFLVISHGTALRNNTDLLARNNKIVEKFYQKRLISHLNILREDCEIVLKPEQETAVSELLHGRDVIAVLPIGFGKNMIFLPCFRLPD